MNRQSISTGLGIFSTVLITTVYTGYTQYHTISTGTVYWGVEADSLGLPRMEY